MSGKFSTNTYAKCKPDTIPRQSCQQVYEFLLEFILVDSLNRLAKSSTNAVLNIRHCLINVIITKVLKERINKLNKVRCERINDIAITQELMYRSGDSVKELCKCFASGFGINFIEETQDSLFHLFAKFGKVEFLNPTAEHIPSHLELISNESAKFLGIPFIQKSIHALGKVTTILSPIEACKPCSKSVCNVIQPSANSATDKRPVCP